MNVKVFDKSECGFENFWYSMKIFNVGTSENLKLLLNLQPSFNCYWNCKPNFNFSEHRKPNFNCYRCCKPNFNFSVNCEPNFNLFGNCKPQFYKYFMKNFLIMSLLLASDALKTWQRILIFNQDLPGYRLDNVY